MTEINIKETIPDKKSLFNIKRFSFKGLNPDFLIKTIDSSNTNKKVFNENKELQNKGIIFEKSKLIRKFDEIKDIINQSDDRKINDFFGRMAWLDDKFTLFHATFKFNPYHHIKKLEEISGFLHYYYSYSKHIVMIPNIVKSYTPYDEEGNTLKKKVDIISLQEYIRFVDEMYEFFEQMNNKPIFVPISLRFNIGEIESLIEHYMKKERFYLWIDFESSPADLSNGLIGGRVGLINHLLRGSEQFDKCLVMATNVRREIISNIKESISPASDVLSTLCGANIVGVDKEPQRAFPKIEDPSKQKKIIEHKARTFDEATYYYNIQKQVKVNKPLNVTSNSAKLALEFESQKQHFLRNLEIETYLRSKDMLNKYNNGKIIKSLNISGNKKKLF